MTPSKNPARWARVLRDLRGVGAIALLCVAVAAAHPQPLRTTVGGISNRRVRDHNGTCPRPAGKIGTHARHRRAPMAGCSEGKARDPIHRDRPVLVIEQRWRSDYDRAGHQMQPAGRSEHRARAQPHR